MRDRLVAYPPDFIGPIGEGYRCNESEWVASNLNKGDRCWFRKTVPTLEGPIMGPWMVGTFMSVLFYDGVIAKVYEDDPDDFNTYALFCDLGDEIRATAP